MNKLKLLVARVKNYLLRRKHVGVIGNIVADKIVMLRDDIEDELIIAERTNNDVDVAKGRLNLINKIISFIKDDAS